MDATEPRPLATPETIASLRTTIWHQLGGSIDMLENAIRECPESLWSDASKPPEWVANGVVGFWYLAYHALFFLDLNLSGSTTGFFPPPPFDLSELDPEGKLPERSYTKEELLTYLSYCRQKGGSIVLGLTSAHAAEMCEWGTMRLSYFELLLQAMRHVQHHVAQLNLLLRQHTGSAPRWVSQTRHASP